MNSIPANHSEMCKYKDAITIGYQRTSGYIMNLVDISAARVSSVNRQLKEEEAKCSQMAVRSVLRTLQFRAMDDRHDQIEEAHKQTFEWVFRQDSFVQWLEHGNGVFWINGKAGAGKSTLMKFLFNDPRTRRHLEVESSQDPLVLAGVFFHDRGTTLQKSQTGLLKSILHQIIGHTRELAAVTCGERYSSVYAFYRKNPDKLVYEDITNEPMQHEWSRDELLRTFKKILQQNAFPIRLFLLIDGLDEYEGDKDELVDLLQNAVSSLGRNSRIKLCLSSRPWNIFQDAFGDGLNFRLQDLTYRDISLYVSGSLSSRARVRELEVLDGNSTSELFDEIVHKADGVFLWVKLVVKSLINGLRNYDSIADLRLRLEAFPKDLEPLYERMIGEIDEMYVKEARMSEGHQTKILDDKPEYLTAEDQVARCMEVDGRLRSRCAGLLEIKFTGIYSYEETLQYGSLQAETKLPQSRFALLKSTVQYIHQSVKDYFKKPEIVSLLRRLCPDLQFEPHEWLQRAYLREIRDCLGHPFQTFISKREKEPGVVWGPLDEFMHHTRALELKYEIPQTTQLNRLDTMLQRESMLGGMVNTDGNPPHWSTWSGGRVSDPLVNVPVEWKTSLLTFAILSGLEKSVEHTISRPGFMINQHPGRPLLHYAIIAQPGYSSVVDSFRMAQWQLLLEYGADPTIHFFEGHGDESEMLTFAWQNNKLYPEPEEEESHDPPKDIS
ncbi:hypothetical protein HYFRA_00011532 [Hymenoscyphus fraxineus]|uniref:NACHT domain-containing protein n=1 Tax=Hymenoscyphus fraxineus TaxID=746836 RepID=A0A9N9L1W9_9HELO|nr:hypothetical protein HYFRA_00011532 [Hymenoscyphus fraxineus]